ncbi:5636_t:CDS:2 [Gigaspora rosea]|nr:5636_t:CDS:2 [Gigaspora rosea]
MTSSIFTFSERVSVYLSGADKNNDEWSAREFRPKKPLVDKEFEDKISVYQMGQPQGALTILDKHSNFIEFIISKPEEKEGRSEIAYALSSEYWNKGIGQSVLSKIVEVWGPEVCRIGLGEGLDKQNEQYQNIQKKFQCFKGKELEQFRATVRPINVSSWNILEKVGFERVQADISINFEDKVYELPSLDNENSLKYCKKLEYFINDLYLKEKIEAGKLYSIENYEKFTFCKNDRIRFCYKKKV